MAVEVYLLVGLFILLASLVPLQKFFARGFGKNFVVESGDPTFTANILYALILFLFFILFYGFIPDSSKKEGFFFEVSKNNPHCKGAFYGKPASFQFDTVGSGNCSQNPICGYGMIKCDGCKSYGRGYYPNLDPSQKTM